MPPLLRSQIPAPMAPEEAVQVDELGGEVVVRGLWAGDRLALLQCEDGSYEHIAELLARAVVDAEREPIWTAKQWRDFSRRHFMAAMNLFTVAKRLSGLDAEAAEKK